MVIARAIRARSATYARADITLGTVARNWTHEMSGISTSLFMVTATVAPPDAPPFVGCFGLEPALANTAIAYGPYAQWRCDYPF
jgi:hypothetical protein